MWSLQKAVRLTRKFFQSAPGVFTQMVRPRQSVVVTLISTIRPLRAYAHALIRCDLSHSPNRAQADALLVGYLIFRSNYVQTPGLHVRLVCPMSSIHRKRGRVAAATRDDCVLLAHHMADERPEAKKHSQLRNAVCRLWDSAPAAEPWAAPIIASGTRTVSFVETSLRQLTVCLLVTLTFWKITYT